MKLRLEHIRECLEGLVPGIIGTCDPSGMPNVAYLTQAEFVDNEHIALSYQFFNRTRQNILAGSAVLLQITSHLTGGQFRLSLQYLRTETSGPLFERMKAKLAGIAAHEGMTGVFELLGADIYRVLDFSAVPGTTLPRPPLPNRLWALRRASDRLVGCDSLAALLDESIACLAEEFAVEHAMLLIHDEAQGRLYTLASRGYPESGIGSEIAIGHGLIGICARERTPIRIGYSTSEYTYGRSVRESILAAGEGDGLETAIPLPGLPDPASQMAIPVCAQGRLLAVIYLESREDQHFGYDEEDALVSLAHQLGLAIAQFQQSDESAEESTPAELPSAAPAGTTLKVRYFQRNHSVFFDEDYLIKGVAGAILWTLLSDYIEFGQTQFTNKGLRMDPRTRLPSQSENLEARLVLLQKRLDERGPGIRLVKTERGRFTLEISHPLSLEQL